MPSASHIFQGSYVYLLIFQVIIVTGLFISAMWLVVRRLRAGGPPEETWTTEGQEPTAIHVQHLEVVENLGREQQARIAALETELAQLEKSAAHVKELDEKNRALREKVRYLEQKLLEYEILQEEISTLSHLKVENETLREQLVRAGLSPASIGALPTPEPAPESPEATSPDPEGMSLGEASLEGPGGGDAPESGEAVVAELGASETAPSQDPSPSPEASSGPPPEPETEDERAKRLAESSGIKDAGSEDAVESILGKLDQLNPKP